MKYRLLYTFIAFSRESAILTLWVPVYSILMLLWNGIRDDRDIYFFLERGALFALLCLAMVVLLGAIFTLAMASGIGRWGTAYSTFTSKEEIFTFVHDEMKGIKY